jgi:hypothetical protein
LEESKKNLANLILQALLLVVLSFPKCLQLWLLTGQYGNHKAFWTTCMHMTIAADMIIAASLYPMFKHTM